MNKMQLFLMELLTDLGIDTTKDMDNINNQLIEKNMSIEIKNGLISSNETYFSNNGKLIGVMIKDLNGELKFRNMVKK